MKNSWIIVFSLLSLCVNAQTTTDDSMEQGSVERLGQMGKAYISEIKKIGVVSYSDISLVVNIRKERSFSNGSVAKDIYFSGTVGEAVTEGFIEESEIDDAINALRYINDSLLTMVPENETHFAKRFSNSYLVIYASYIPGSGTLFEKAEWDVSIQLNENGNNQAAIHIKQSDLPAFIQIIQACKEKLKAF